MFGDREHSHILYSSLLLPKFVTHVYSGSNSLVLHQGDGPIASGLLLLIVHVVELMRACIKGQLLLRKEHK